MSNFGDKMDENLNWISSIKVLVVDHKMDFLSYAADVLHYCSFEVTCVDHSGAALKLLSKNKSEFDLLLIDSGMSDVDVYTMLSLAKNMDILPIVMSEIEDDAFLLEALKRGAFLVLNRPLTIDAVRHMRQDIIRERMLKNEKRKNNNRTLKATTQAITIQENRSSGSKRKRKESGEPIKQVINQVNIDNNVIYHSSEEEEEEDVDDSMKKKVCLEWTQELHQKFVDAINMLGDGRCFPKEILKRMDVPGLTRMQVASHLQKCRRSGERRTATPTSSNSYPLSSNFSYSERKFGCMPFIKTDQNLQEDHSTIIGINLSISGWKTNERHNNEQSYRAFPMVTPKNIAHPSYDILFPLGNGLDSNQHEGNGSRINKTTNNYFQQAVVSGLHDVGQGGSDPYNFSSIARETSDDFPDFLKDIDGNGPNDELIS